MKNLIILGLISICFLHLASAALNCKAGYYDPGSGTKCFKCAEKFESCSSSSVGIYVSSVTGWKSDTVGGVTVSSPYCNPFNYNSKTNNCDVTCSTGCSSCAVDVGFCLSCHNGYVWNNYQCLPAVIGL